MSTTAVNAASTTAMAPVKDVELRVPCYCEENVWRLAYRKWKQQADSKKYYAVFVSNPSKCVCFFHQKASGNPLKPVFWDYHVLLFEYDATTQTTVVLDIDSYLPYPYPLSEYLDQAFPEEESENPQQQHQLDHVAPWFRVVPAEIFLNYDCDLSAVDLFHRIVNTLSRVARSDAEEPKSGSTIGFVAGAGAARAEKMRNEHRELRLDAMRALRQVLASLHASIVEPMKSNDDSSLLELTPKQSADELNSTGSTGDDSDGSAPSTPNRATKVGDGGKKNLVQIYDSKKKRRQEESEAVLRFNQKPSAGIKYAAECGHLNGDDPADIARYLLVNKDRFEKTQIGEYLGREAEYQGGISLKVLHEYVRLMDFSGLQFDDGIRYYLSGFRLPGEAQKVSFPPSRK